MKKTVLMSLQCAQVFCRPKRRRLTGHLYVLLMRWRELSFKVENYLVTLIIRSHHLAAHACRNNSRNIFVRPSKIY